MVVEVECQRCKDRFRADEKLVGKRARCPKCSSIIAVVAEASSDELRANEQAVHAPESAVTADGPKWYVMTGDQQCFGPMTKMELDRWLVQGRLNISCQVFQEGWSQWKWAMDALPTTSVAAAKSAGLLCLPFGILFIVFGGLMGLLGPVNTPSLAAGTGIALLGVMVCVYAFRWLGEKPRLKVPK